MVGRPPLPIGTHGKITVYPYGSSFRAFCKVRDDDGHVRRVSASGKTEPAAERNLKKRINERVQHITGSLITSNTRVEKVAEILLARLELEVEAEDTSPNTLRTYTSNINNHIIPSLGQYRMRECIVPYMARFLEDTNTKHSYSVAKTSRAVLSAIFELAVRDGALDANPIKEVGDLHGARSKPAKALTQEQRVELLQKLDEDERAVKLDLPDLCRFMIGTGVRIAEAIAPMWDSIDMIAASAEMGPNIVRKKGVGLIRWHGKSAAALRTLPLPVFLVLVLAARRPGGENIGDLPVFPALRGKRKGWGWRDPTNVGNAFRDALDRAGFGWVTPHVFRKTAALIWDEGGMSARQIADLLGHAKVSLTQDTYMARKIVNPEAAALLDKALSVQPPDDGNTPERSQPIADI